MTTVLPFASKISPQATQELLASYREGYGLPGRFYQDAGLYLYEWETIWHQGWIFVGHARSDSSGASTSIYMPPALFYRQHILK